LNVITPSKPSDSSRIVSSSDASKMPSRSLKVSRPESEA
jgi:hypothetical protein